MTDQNPNIQYINYSMPTQEPEKKKHGFLRVLLIILAIIVVFAGAASPLALKEYKYISAEKLVENNQFDGAIEVFTGLKNFRDSQEKVLDTKYLKAQYLADKQGDYEAAINLMQEIEPYEDSRDLAEEYIGKYVDSLLENDKYDEAVAYLESIDGIDGSDDIKDACDYYDALNDYNNKRYYESMEKFALIGDYKESKKYFAMSEHQCIVMMGYGNSNLDAQKKIFDELSEFKDEEEIKQMLLHPIYNPLKLFGEWKEVGGDTELAFTDEGIKIGLPVKVAGKCYLDYNAEYVCAINANTKEETKIFKILSFEEPDSASPKKMVIFNLADEKEYTFERVK